MSNPLKYVTSTPTGTLRHANLGAGVASIQYDETFNSGLNPSTLTTYYLVYEPVNGASTRIYAPANSTELITLAQSKGSTETTEAGALTWLSDNGYYPANKVLENIVTDELKLNLVPTSATSYPRSGTDILDLSGEANDGSLNNGISFDEDSRALIFDGVDDILFSGVGTDYPFKHHSWEMWFKTSQVDSGGVGGLVGLDYGRVMYLTGGNSGSITYTLYSNMSQPNVVVQSISGGTNLLDNEWHQVICSRGTSTCEIWIDGALVTTASNGGQATWNGINQWSTMASRFGDNPNNVGLKFEGEISNIRIYNKQLSSAEVLQNYYQGPIVTSGLVFATDASNLISFNPGETTAYNLAGDNDMSVLNGLGWGNSGNGYFSSDGVDDALHASDASNLDLDTFTLEGWVWWDQHKNYGSLLVKGPGGSGGVFNYCFFFYQNNIVFGFGNGTSFNSVSISTPTIDEWHHITGTFDGTTLKFYLNGTLQASLVWAQTPYQNNNDLQVIQASYPIDGRVGAARLYNRALTSEEVQQNYNANVKKFT